MSDSVVSSESKPDMPLAKKDKVEEAEELTPETFDLAAWIAGARPTRRSVTVYSRLDLAAELDVLNDEIQYRKSVGQSVRELKERALQVAEDMQASAMTVTVEARTHEAIERAVEGIDENDVAAYNLAAITAHIVEPKGFTPELLAEFNEVSPLQVNRIMRACTEADANAPEVTVPFLDESSRNRAGSR